MTAHGINGLEMVNNGQEILHNNIDNGAITLV